MSKLINFYIRLNIYKQLFPLLVLYIIIAISFPKDPNFSDQGRYLGFADCILHGYYSLPFPDINLWNGPGYPIILAIFVFLKFSYAGLRVLNAFLLYFSLILCYKTIRIYSAKKQALLFTLMLGAYFPIYDMLRIMMTECLTWFLISLICYSFAKSYQQKKLSIKLLLLSSFAIAYLAMTKVIFGYVILAMLFISLFLYLLPGFRNQCKRSIAIFFVAFLFCLPWLFYTYHLTGKIFYWSNAGSMSLYTMSSPYANETGQWHTEEQLLKNPNHKVFIDSIMQLKPLQKDEAYKTQAVKNIKEHPLKYLTNIVSNTGQLLFFPSDLAPDTIFAYVPFIPNMFVVVFIVITTLIALRQYRKVPPEIIFLFLFILTYLFTSIFVTAYRRMFHITMPFWFMFFAYVFNNLIIVKFKTLRSSDTNISE